MTGFGPPKSSRNGNINYVNIIQDKETAETFYKETIKPRRDILIKEATSKIRINKQEVSIEDGTIVIFKGKVQRHGTEHNSEIERKNDEPSLFGFFVSLSQFLAQEKKKKREKKVQKKRKREESTNSK